MHGLDSSIPLFHTCARGTHIVVTLELVFDVLRVPKVEHPDYPDCEHLMTVSKDEMIFAFCECPADLDDRQFTPCKPFAKGPSHFILSIIDVYRDTATRDKLIFPLTITQILCHFSIPFPFSDHFPVMCAIDYATVKRSEEF